MTSPNPDEILSAARAAHQSNRFAEAERGYRRILTSHPNYAPAIELLGVLEFQNQHYPAAAELFWKLTVLSPCASAFNMLGEALRASNRFDDAIGAYRSAIEFDPKVAGPYTNMGMAFAESGRNAEAIPCFRQAVAIEPNNIRSLHALGNAELASNDPDEAAEVFERAVAQFPDVLALAMQLCGAYYLGRRLDKCVETIDRLVGKHPSLRFDRGIALLAMGRYAEGFADYEWRRRIPSFTPREFSQPEWNGTDPTGRTIFVHVEQGYGDAIQFARYIPMLVAAGANVIFDVFGEMHELMRSISPAARVIGGYILPPQFDLHVPLLSLPRIFETTLETIPAQIPYLHASPARIEKWNSRISHAPGLKVGLVWGGNSTPDPRRSVPIADLGPLTDVPSVSWFSLQTGASRASLKDAPAGLNLIDLGGELKDFSDTAGVLLHLDLFITIDTAAAHLGGALGARTWTMLPYACDWRWTMSGDHTPWYPAMRLFRQGTIGDWKPVIAQIRQELIAHSSTHGSKHQ